MNESKPIEVNSASIVDLKAELYRKQQSFQLKKLSQSQQQVVENETNLYDINCNQIKYKLGKRIRQKGDKELIANNKRKYGLKSNEDKESKLSEEQIAVEKALQKSRQMLEIKSQLYEKLSKNPNLLNKKDEDLEEESDERILVDFHRKAFQEISSERRDKEEEEETEEEWTEFVDSLGRSRKCLKKDLQHFIDIDRQTFRHKKSEDIANKEQQNSDLSSVPNLSTNNELMTNDLRRELERREWETNARNEVTNERQSEDLKSNNLNIHYQNVKHNEIRDHGVAYYAFDEDQSRRQQQMDLLNQLRDQTKTRKQQKLNLKQKRKQLMRERLAKVAQRKGIAFEPKVSSSDSSDEEISDIGPAVPEPKPMPTSVREWDVGKPDLHEVLSELRPKSVNTSHKTYIEERRDRRNPDFAPPSSYNQNQFKNNFKDKRTTFNSQKFKSEEKYQKNTRIGSNFDNINGNNNNNNNNNKIESISESNKLKPDVNQVISSALSYFRNNLKQ